VRRCVRIEFVDSEWLADREKQILRFAQDDNNFGEDDDCFARDDENYVVKFEGSTRYN
jgi:hypothetical protein